MWPWGQYPAGFHLFGGQNFRLFCHGRVKRSQLHEHEEKEHLRREKRRRKQWREVDPSPHSQRGACGCVRWDLAYFSCLKGWRVILGRGVNHSKPLIGEQRCWWGLLSESLPHSVGTAVLLLSYYQSIIVLMWKLILISPKTHAHFCTNKDSKNPYRLWE